MQTAIATQTRKRNLQDLLLSKLRRSRMGATVFLVNGFQIRGEIRGFDAFVVVIYSDGKQQMLYKHAISSPNFSLSSPRLSNKSASKSLVTGLSICDVEATVYSHIALPVSI